MESLKEGLLKFKPNTLWEIRKEFNLADPGRMDEAIDIIEEWIKKQEHFLKKDFRREYLERVIISTKGRLERTKFHLDKRCTLRTLAPELVEPCNVKEDLRNLDGYIDSLLPNLTPQHHRVYLLKLDETEFHFQQLTNFYKKCASYWEYVLSNDYNNGFVIILDCRNVNILDLVSKINLIEARKLAKLALEGYGFRMKGFHVLSGSKFVDALMTLVRQVLTPNLRERLKHHSDLESLYNVIPKDILPVEYGGEEISIYKLNELWRAELSSKEHMKHLIDINEAKIDESRRPLDKINEEHLGISGTFRNLNVD